MAVTNLYADGDDVQALLNQLGGATLTLGAASTPTITQVEKWLDQLAAEVDSVLIGVGYSTVPATGANDILMIGRYVAMMGAYMAYDAGFMFDDDPDKAKFWKDEWSTFIDRLIAKTMRLQDQSTRSKMGTVKPMRYYED